MTDVTQMVEQPKPSELSGISSGRVIALEMFAAGGPPLGNMIFPEMSPEDIIFSAIPKFREMTGVRVPILFRTRAATADELAEIARQHPNT